MIEGLTHIVAATDLAVEMPTGTETGIQRADFLSLRVYLTSTACGFVRNAFTTAMQFRLSRHQPLHEDV